jgi:hypothetical protein
MRPLPPLPVASSKSWSLVKTGALSNSQSVPGTKVPGANEYTVPRVEAAPLEVVPPELVVP